MAKLTPERLNEIEDQLMKLQHELQTVILVDKDIQGTINRSQSNIIGSIAEARNELRYVANSILSYR